MKKTVKDIQVTGKKVLLRTDFNVPLTNEKINDDTRIQKALPTIEYLINQGARIIICSHLGRPKGKVVESLRMDPVAARLSEYLGKDVIKVDDTVNGEVTEAIEKMASGDILVLENTRFYPGEKDNDKDFARKLAELADIYVNDAFGTAHRAHASTHGVAQFIPAVAGLLMAREIETLEKVLKSPKKPFVTILGGAKVSDKIQMVERLLELSDILLVGGGMAHTFLKAQGFQLGDSKYEKDHVKTAEKILEKADQKMVLPVDVVLAQEFDEKAEIKTVPVNRVPQGWKIVDIGPKTVSLFKEKLKPANMVVWNGPLGVSEIKSFANGTMAIAHAMAELAAVTIVGGGDSAAAIAAAELSEKITHVSTGGGAFLHYLEGKELPGIAVLEDKQ